MSDIVLLYCTAPSTAEAEKVAEAVVGQRLAACANIIPGMRSLYWWEGKLERGEEVVLILKTRSDLAELASAAVRKAHSYSVPCILPLKIGEGGNPDYVSWLLAETGKAAV